MYIQTLTKQNCCHSAYTEQLLHGFLPPQPRIIYPKTSLYDLDLAFTTQNYFCQQEKKNNQTHKTVITKPDLEQTNVNTHTSLPTVIRKFRSAASDYKSNMTYPVLSWKVHSDFLTFFVSVNWSEAVIIVYSRRCSSGLQK